jgi:hypothetical protein
MRLAHIHMSADPPCPARLPHLPALLLTSYSPALRLTCTPSHPPYVSPALRLTRTPSHPHSPPLRRCGLELVELDERVVVKVPATLEGFKACRRLVDDGLPVTITGRSVCVSVGGCVRTHVCGRALVCEERVVEGRRPEVRAPSCSLCLLSLVLYPLRHRAPPTTLPPHTHTHRHAHLPIPCRHL